MSVSTTNIQVRVDKNLKIDAERLFSDVGLDLPTAIRLFLTQSLLKNGIPFSIERDPFYSTKNQAALEKSIRQLQEGKEITKTIEELESMAL